MADIIIYVVKEQRKWRNWQTRRTKDPVIALDREGSSPSFRRVKTRMKRENLGILSFFAFYGFQNCDL